LEAVAVRVGAFDLLVGRRVEPAWRQLLHRSFLAPLAILWAMAAGLGWLLARSVVVPLRALALRLPGLASEDVDQGELPGHERSDEIGQVARAFQAARTALRKERERRTQAERLALLGRVSTGLAHEIQNPVAAIRMHAQVLQQTPRERLADQAVRALPHMLDGASRIEALVQQWMYLARPQPPDRVRVELRPLLESALNMLEPMLRHGGVVTEVDIPPDLAVQGDRRRLQQVLHNVITNAAQAMAGRGTITIRAERRDTSVLLTVRDTGPGFSAAALERARELFYSEREGGMGVGLNVCDEIIRAHGGQMRLGNAPGGGAEVTLDLPEAS
jgi:signal transduction histidine kinase